MICQNILEVDFKTIYRYNLVKPPGNKVRNKSIIWIYDSMICQNSLGIRF